MSNETKTNKDVILQEITKTMTRLKNQGVNLEGTYFGFRENEEDLEQKESGMVVWRKDDEFVKIFPKEIAQIAPLLNGTELLIVIHMTKCMSYSDGLLRKGGKANGNPITFNDIMQLTGFSKKTVIKSMANLVRKRVYFYGRTGTKETDPYKFYVNPYIFFKGKYINPTLVSMFKNYTKEII